MVERGPEKAGVGGPIPALGINFPLIPVYGNLRRNYGFLIATYLNKLVETSLSFLPHCKEAGKIFGT